MSSTISQCFEKVGDEFILVFEELSFVAAVEACNEMSANLARISSVEEFDTVVGLKTLVPEGISLDDTWIGVISTGDVSDQSSYEFVDGYQDISFFNVDVGVFPWDVGDPDFGLNEACVDMSLGNIEPRWENHGVMIPSTIFAVGSVPYLPMKTALVA